MNANPSSVREPANVNPPSAGLIALGFLTSGADRTPLLSETGEPGEVIGRYVLVEPLGEGGFGVVWRARQHEPIQREVALKVIKPGLDSREVICRFETERQALALMDHPNIAAVLDAGSTADGRPYFVMELVQGTPLAEYCDARKFTIPERLRLFIPVCQAVQHAHQKSVLHRDLKPSNILVTEIDGRPVPKVIDFGIAKALAPAAGALPFGRTQAGIVVGTPQYMSPEQAGCGLDVDTRSDVYSLGVILCELLTGRTQLPPETADFAGALRLICESASVRPSLLVHPVTGVVEQAAVQRRVTTARFARTLRGDLDWIALKALEKDRCRRYETPLALAVDLQKYLEGKTVSAVAPTWRYQAGKFMRRHRVPLIAASLAVAALVTGTVVSLWQAANAERTRLDAQANYERTRKAVEVYLSKAADHPRLQQEDFKDLRLDLFKAALPLYEDMSKVKGNDPKLKFDRSWAIGRMGDVYLHGKDYREAEHAYRKALEIDTQLVKEFPQNNAYQYALGMRYNNLASTLHSLSRPPEAIASLEKAQALLEMLVSREPDNDGYRGDFATVASNRGVFLKETNQPAESETCYRRAIELHTQRVTKDPKNSAAWKNLGTCFTLLGNLFREVERTKEADEQWQKAVEAFERALQEDPLSHTARSSLVTTILAQGKAAFRIGHHPTGDASFKRARELARRNVDEFPGYSVYRENLMEAINVTQIAAAKRGQDEESDAMLKELKSELQRLIAAFPNTAKYKTILANTLAKLGAAASRRKESAGARDYYEQALALYPLSFCHLAMSKWALEAGDHGAAARHVMASSEDQDSKWQECEKAAQRLLQAIPLAQDDPKLSADERVAVIERYSSAAVQFLKEAIKKGYTGISEFRVPEKTADFQKRGDFLALTGQPPQPPAGVSSSFHFDFLSDKDPGVRLWRREGLIWVETQPSGKQNRYVIMGPLTVDFTPGIEARKAGGGLALFIPDLKSGEPRCLHMKSGEIWKVLGHLTEMK